MEENFAEWLIEKRLDWLADAGKITSIEDLETELLDAFTVSNKEGNSDEKTCATLFADRAAQERFTVYRQGVLDGIRLMKEIDQE